jgi:hypothetical protein
VQGLDEWAFAHYQHHLAIASAIRDKHNIRLDVTNIWPMNPRNIQVWLEAHQFIHNEMNAVLHVQGNDLSAINWDDDKQRQGFFFLNFQEHRSAATNTQEPI